MRHNPASGAVVIMLRSLKMHGMAQAVGELTEQGSPAFEAALPILSQLLKAETADREVRSTAYQLKAARFPNYRDLAGFDFTSSVQRFTNIPEPFKPLLEPQYGPEVPLDAKGEIDIKSDEIENWTPTGDTYHVVLNGLGLLTDNGIWEGGSYIVELTFSYLDKIHQLEDLRLQYAPNNGVQVDEGNIYSHINVVFSPTWYQVWPGTDLTLRTAVGVGINNSSPNNFGGDEEIGSGTFGAEFLINQAWTVSARYNFFFGPWKNHTAGRWKDRDNVSFSIKRTF